MNDLVLTNGWTTNDFVISNVGSNVVWTITTEPVRTNLVFAPEAMNADVIALRSSLNITQAGMILIILAQLCVTFGIWKEKRNKL